MELSYFIVSGTRGVSDYHQPASFVDDAESGYSGYSPHSERCNYPLKMIVLYTPWLFLLGMVLVARMHCRVRLITVVVEVIHVVLDWTVHSLCV